MLLCLVVFHVVTEKFDTNTSYGIPGLFVDVLSSLEGFEILFFFLMFWSFMMRHLRIGSFFIQCGHEKNNGPFNQKHIPFSFEKFSCTFVFQYFPSLHFLCLLFLEFYNSCWITWTDLIFFFYFFLKDYLKLVFNSSIIFLNFC